MFHLLRNKRLEEWMAAGSNQQVRKQEPLGYLLKIQVFHSYLLFD